MVNLTIKLTGKEADFLKLFQGIKIASYEIKDKEVLVTLEEESLLGNITNMSHEEIMLKQSEKNHQKHIWDLWKCVQELCPHKEIVDNSIVKVDEYSSSRSYGFICSCCKKWFNSKKER